jgi:hypothetical protein
VAQQPYSGLGRLIVEVSRSHTDTPHSIWLAWTRDRPIAETFTWKHTTLTNKRQDIHAPGGIETRNPSKRAAANSRLRPRGQWDRQTTDIMFLNIINGLVFVTRLSVLAVRKKLMIKCICYLCGSTVTTNTHTCNTYSSESHHQAYDRKPWKSNSVHFDKRKKLPLFYN